MPQDRNIWLLNNNNVCYYCTIFVSNILKFLLNSITWFLYIGYNYTNMLMSELTSYIAACRCFRIFELRTGAKSAIRDCLFLSWALSVPLHRLRFVIHVVFLPREAYATHMHSAVYAMARLSVCLSVCQSVCLSQAGLLPKRLNRSRLFSAKRLCYKGIRAFPRIRVLPSETLSETLNFTDFYFAVSTFYPPA